MIHESILAGDIVNHDIILQRATEDDELQKQDSEITLGPGLIQDHLQQIRALKSGRLYSKHSPNRLWIDNYQKRYVATAGDCVLGVVLSRTGEAFKVDIGCHQPALLPWLSFEGATKRNRPNIKVPFYGPLQITY
jgi:exosome complex component RRP40